MNVRAILSFQSCLLRVLIRAIPFMLCGTLSAGCFTAHWYSLPIDGREHRVFGSHIVDIRIYSKNCDPFEYRRNDYDFHVITRVESDTLMIKGDSNRVVRIEKLCISGECLPYVYCPRCARDIKYQRVYPSGGIAIEKFYPKFDDCGWLEIPEKCQTIEITFDAVLIDSLADSVIAVERVSLSLDRKQNNYFL